MKNRRVKQASFAVLNCKATAVLVEGGFMDTKADYAVITSTKGQQAYAKAIAESVIQYLKLTKKETSFKIKVVNCDELNARKGPGVSYDVANVVKVDTILTIVGESGNWYKTKSGLYVSKSYCEKI